MLIDAPRATSSSDGMFPLMGLVVRTQRLELRLPGGFDEIANLADLAAEGIHDPGFMPFASEWTDGTPVQVRQRVFSNTLRDLAAATDPSNWVIPFTVHEKQFPRAPIGVMSVGLAVGVDDYTSRDVVTRSWSGHRYQGLGYGKEMRSAVLALAFEGLGALRAVTKVREGNAASIGVTRSLGYTLVRSRDVMSRGAPTKTHTYELHLDTWLMTRAQRPEVSWTGLEPVREYYGC